jgi:nucleotide-binding universal stress UspA family protein
LISPLRVRLYEYAAKFMEKAKVVSAQHGIVFHHKIVYGDPKSDIVDFVKQHKFDLIVIGLEDLE